MANKSTRTICIDVDAAAMPGKSGIGYYTASLLEALAANAPDNVRFVAHYFNFLGRNHPVLPRRANITYRQSRLMPRQAANLLRRAGIPMPYGFLTRTRADFVLFPNFLSRPMFSKVPYAAAIHDLTYLDLPEYVSERNRRDLENLVPITLSGASFVIALSDTMASEIKRHYPSYKNPILAELLPVEPPRRLPPDETGSVLRQMGVQKKYILFMGNLEPRKNLVKLIHAYVQLPKSLQNEYSLVLAGGPGWNNEQITAAIQKARDSGADILTPGYITDDQRSALYDSASLFSFVSLYEGYGMPALEAMSYSIPVLASDIPVLREVCGSAAVFCDPENIASITRSMQELLTNENLRKDIMKQGKAVVAARNWDDIAQKILTTISQILER